MNKLGDKILRFLVKFSETPYILAIRDGFILTLTPTIIGSLFLLLASLPISGYADFWYGILGANWHNYLLEPLDSTFAIISLFLSLTVAYKLASHYKLDAISVAIISLVCFLIATPHEPSEKGYVIPLINIGSGSSFLAILIALLSTELFRFFTARGLSIRLSDQTPTPVANSFSALLPGLFTVVLVWAGLLLLRYFHLSLSEIIVSEISAPLARVTNTLPVALFYAFSSSFFWFLGIHGDSLVDTIFVPSMLQLLDQNRAAFQNGLALPNIVMKPFFDTYVHLGGTGATLPMVFCLLFFSRRRSLKALGRVSLPTSLFQINEPILFGLPIILNPIMFLPFVLTPVVLTVISYFAMSYGLLPKPTGVMIPWTTPIFLSGYLVSGGSLFGVLWQGINLCVATLIYFPFFKIVDRYSRGD